jgi:hypothetical protein
MAAVKSSSTRQHTISTKTPYVRGAANRLLRAPGVHFILYFRLGFLLEKVMVPVR